ncbi:MAG: phosphoribosylaminoimidazolesuccinocarboxamide synthase [Firmicutes bacterium]|nr:phosphoribosylaminoimidazolesuccinocarboxamide synthase [Bacillota bacterium]MDH7496447.1 phosphoribosylaminoimidazolesuccinocarboxamide synthase [Bacillota bacterium]
MGEELVYEGKAKRVYRMQDPRHYLIEFKDDATAQDGRKRGRILGKGVVNCQVSAVLFSHLASRSIPTHFVEVAGESEMIVRRLSMLPLEVVVRNIVAGSLAKRLGIAEGTKPAFPIVEFYYKSDALGDPLVVEDHVIALGFATRDVVAKLREASCAVNRELAPFLADRGLTLVDFKLEFGWCDGELLLGDEISPDTCRLWDAATGDRLDKDRFRRDMGGVEEAYAEVLRRVSGTDRWSISR